MNDNSSAFSSKKYDSEIKRTLPYYEEFYKQIIDVVRTHNPDSLTWLDVGCGTGKMAETALIKSKIERFVFCDSSAAMIEIVRDRFDFLDTDFLLSNVLDLTFHDEFDVVTAIQTNHYLQPKDRITSVGKCYEALKPGGIFVNFETFAPADEQMEALYLDRWKSFQLDQGKSNSESEKHIARYKRDYFPISLSEHLQIMTDCGFKAVEILWLSYMQAGIVGIK